MPSSLEIGLLVLGAFLLVVALLGGNFEIFTTKVTGEASKGMRLISFMLGLGFIGLAINGPVKNKELPPLPKPVQDHTQDKKEEQLLPLQPDPPPKIFDISGIWYDSEEGGRFDIVQQGTKIHFTGSYLNGVRSEGTGELRWQTILVDFRTNLPSTGTGRLILSTDGKTASGLITDSSEGSYVQKIHR